MRLISCLLGLLIIAGCASVDSLYDRVPDAHDEVLYHDVMGQRADQIRVFGVGLGSSEQEILDTHGEPDVVNEYTFGRVKNMEYRLGQNSTAVLYHLDQGVVSGILLTRDANPLLVNNTVLNQSLADVYGLLGIPTLSDDRHLERVFYYDDIGYEVYLRKKQVDRIYFTAPDRGIVPVGTKGNETSMCAQVVTPAVDPLSGECFEFATPCDVPRGWESVDACGN